MIHAECQPQIARDAVLKLTSTHEMLRTCLRELEIETAKDVPDMASLAKVRLRLAQTSRIRSGLADAVFGLQSRSAMGAELACLMDLRGTTQHVRAASTAHIARWTPQAITADWDGYRTASQEMRASMQSQIVREARLLRQGREQGGSVHG